MRDRRANNVSNAPESRSSSPIRTSELPRQLAADIVELIALALNEGRQSEIAERLAAFGLKICDC